MGSARVSPRPAPVPLNVKVYTVPASSATAYQSWSFAGSISIVPVSGVPIVSGGASAIVCPTVSATTLPLAKTTTHRALGDESVRRGAPCGASNGLRRSESVILPGRCEVSYLTRQSCGASTNCTFGRTANLGCRAQSKTGRLDVGNSTVARRGAEQGSAQR